MKSRFCNYRFWLSWLINFYVFDNVCSRKVRKNKLQNKWLVRRKRFYFENNTYPSLGHDRVMQCKRETMSDTSIKHCCWLLMHAYWLIDWLFHCFIAYKYICVVLWLLVSKSPLTNSKQSIKTGSCPTVYFLCTLPPSRIFQLMFVLFCVPSAGYGEASHHAVLLTNRGQIVASK